jgi:hypothetical protein
MQDYQGDRPAKEGIVSERMVAKPGVPNDGITRFSGGSAFEKCGRQ